MNESLIVPQTNKGIITPSGRTIYRHESNKGSVIEFKMYNKNVSLFVSDSNYFSTKRYSTFRSNSNYKMMSNKLDIYLYSSNTYSLQTLPPITDTELENKLNISDACDYAKNGINWQVSKGISSEAISFTRNIKDIFNDGMDVPNLFELCVIYIEADNIQALDPNYKNSNYLFIGYNPNKNGRWSNGSSYPNYHAWSSTFDNQGFSVNLICDSHVQEGNGSLDSCMIIPIKEI